ncbi:helix-turn-helix domain-containing protein [Streptomyces collinus]|uniref:helix-turn-helix domain-containing protein n=1 Tax=Streptomyces collinus TaxID=42684 RepID=UPI0036C9899C
MRREDREGLVGHDLSEFAGAVALAGLLSKIVCTSPDMGPATAHHLGDAIIACVHAIIAEARGTAVGDRTEVLFAELTGWIDEHLAEEHLTAELLASGHFLSTRYVRKLFADHDTTVMAYVRLRRLERIRDELLQPWSVGLPVSTIAARWGFRDPSVFSRAFTRQFGQGPHSFRKDALHARASNCREAAEHSQSAETATSTVTS